MAYQVSWLPAAIDDLDAIASYIGRDSPAHAAAVVSRMFAAAIEVSNFPMACARVLEWDHDMVRQRIVYSYRLIFRASTDPEQIEVLAVIHGARLLPEELRNRA